MDLEEINKLGRLALEQSHSVYQKLGSSGIEKVQMNRFGEVALRGDRECEEAVIDIFKKNKVPITIISEEHGKVELGNEFLGVLDGLDGTNKYISFVDGNKNARFGTMFAILNGSNPRYSDYIFSGIMEHPTRKLICTSQDKKSFVLDIEHCVERAAKVSKRQNFDRNARIFCEHTSLRKQYFELLKKLEYSPTMLKDGVLLRKPENLKKFSEEIGFVEGVKISGNGLWRGIAKSQPLRFATSSYGLKPKELGKTKTDIHSSLVNLILKSGHQMI